MQKKCTWSDAKRPNFDRSDLKQLTKWNRKCIGNRKRVLELSKLRLFTVRLQVHM